MKLDPKIMKLAKEKYEESRSERRSELLARLDELRRTLPEFADAERAQFSLGAEIAEACLSGNPEEKLAEIRPRAEAVAAQKEKILLANGLPASGEVEARCRICEDEGFVGGKPCACMMEVYRSVQMKENARLFRLSPGERRDFRPEDYSDGPNPKTGIPDRAYMCRLMERLDAAGEVPARSIAFTGESGVGKKYLTALLMRRAIDAGVFAVYVPSYALARLFEEERFSRNDYTASDELSRCREATLLVIDELGTEQTTAYSAAALLDLLDTRLADGLTTVITTGLTDGDIASRYNPETLFRIREQFTQYSIPLTVLENERKV